MKKLLVFCSFVLAIRTSAQISIGAEGISLAAGTIVSFETLTLIPQGNISLANTTLQKSITPVNIGNGLSIPNVINLSTPLSFSGTVRFYYQESELNGNAESLLLMDYLSSAAWSTSSTAIVNTTDNYIEDVLSSQTIDAVTASFTSALPVSFLSFTAKRQANASVLLQWKTANEQQNSHFAIERSGDGVHYQTIGTVQASGGTTGSYAYSFSDNDPLAGTNFYRLKQYDLDGREHVYGVRIVQSGSAVVSLALYPNPVVNSFKLELSTMPVQPLTYAIQNTSGQVVQTGLIYSREQWLETSRLPAGVYVISLENGQTARFFKQ